MTQELKIKLTDPQAIEDKVQNLGATLLGETEFTDTYFNQPEGDVFKVSDTKDGYQLIQLHKTPEGKFEFTKNNKIENANEVIAEMGNEYGIRCILKGKRKTFTLNDLTVTFHTIENVGQFLIVSGENPTQDFIVNRLGLQNPEYITVSFDKLATTPNAQSPAPQQ